jgi:predicted DNA-binding ribbon-helix-helix protein
MPPESLGKCTIKLIKKEKVSGLFNSIFRPSWLLIAGVFFTIFLTGCSVQNQLLRNAGDLLSKEMSSSEEDLELLMHASAYHLKVSETLLQEIPDHVKLSESVTRGFTQYAFVFLMDEADRKESESIQIASQLRVRAAKMLMRAKSHGLITLSLKYQSLAASLQNTSQSQTLTISPDDVGLAYWTMTSWAGAISLSKDSPDIVADLPQVLKLAQMAWQANPKFDHGALASMMGTLELARPGGKTANAEKYFDLGIQWRKDQIAPLVSKAENWAVATQDQDTFKKLLNQAIENAKDKTDLTNTVMVRRARWLLTETDNLF